MRRHWLAVTVALLPAFRLAAEERISFNRDVRPIFAATCWTCHGPAAQLSRLDLRTRESTLKGGERGAVLIPGSAERSRLYRMAAGLEKPAMPLGSLDWR